MKKTFIRLVLLCMILLSNIKTYPDNIIINDTVWSGVSEFVYTKIDYSYQVIKEPTSAKKSIICKLSDLSPTVYIYSSKPDHLGNDTIILVGDLDYTDTIDDNDTATLIIYSKPFLFPENEKFDAHFVSQNVRRIAFQ